MRVVGVEELKACSKRSPSQTLGIGGQVGSVSSSFELSTKPSGASSAFVVVIGEQFTDRGLVGLGHGNSELHRVGVVDLDWSSCGRMKGAALDGADLHGR